MSVPAEPGEGDFAIAVRGSAPPLAAPASARSLSRPDDPLDEFFFREDEEGSPFLDGGLAAAAGRREVEVASRRREFLIFRLGSEEYGLEIGQVREILKVTPITEVPRTAPAILGIMTVRGEVVTVFDPRRLLGLPPAATAPQRVVVCDVGDGPCGLVVDSVAGVARLAPSAIEARPTGVGGADPECIQGIGREGERLLILLAAAVLLRRLPAPVEERR